MLCTLASGSLTLVAALKGPAEKKTETPWPLPPSWEMEAAFTLLFIYQNLYVRSLAPLCESRHMGASCLQKKRGGKCGHYYQAFRLEPCCITDPRVMLSARMCGGTSPNAC